MPSAARGSLLPSRHLVAAQPHVLGLQHQAHGRLAAVIDSSGSWARNPRSRPARSTGSYCVARPAILRHTYVESLAFLAEAHVLADDAARGLEPARRATELAQLEGSPFNVGLPERAAGRAARATGDAAAGAHAHLAQAIAALHVAAYQVAEARALAT